jgi:hypothetical protein
LNFRAAIALLIQPRVIRVLRYNRDGSLSLQLCYIQLIGAPTISSASTKSKGKDDDIDIDFEQIMLAYEIVPEVSILTCEISSGSSSSSSCCCALVVVLLVVVVAEVVVVV